MMAKCLISTMKSVISASFIIIIVMFSCSSSKKGGDASRLVPGARLLPALPSSQINIPVKVYMKPLLFAMDSLTPLAFTNDQWPNYTVSSCDFRYKYRLTRSPIDISCVNNMLRIRFRGNYQIGGSRCLCTFNQQITPWVSGSCGFGKESLRRVDISLQSGLQFLPDHQLRTKTTLDPLKPVDKCQVTLMNNDMTGQVMDSIRVSIENYCAVFDSVVSAVNDNSLLSRWRQGGSRVMPVSSYGFLNLNPTGLRIGRFNLIKDSLCFSLGYTGTPQFSSDSIRLVTNRALPALNSIDNPPGIYAYLDAIYEYKFFNNLLNDSLHNRPFDVEGRTFVIKDVHVSGSNEGRIQISVSFTGNRKGTMSISGIPELDTARQVLSMSHLEVDLDTKDLLVNIAKKLIRKKVMKQLKDQSVLDIAALIRQNKQSIEARLSQSLNDWLYMHGTIGEIKLLGLLPQKDYIQVQALIRGNIEIIGIPPTSLIGKISGQTY